MKTMKTMKMKPIVNKLYTFKVTNKQGEVGIGLTELSFTRFALFSVCDTEARQLLPCLQIIARQEKLDLEQDDQFVYAMDRLLSAVSWN